MTSQFTASVSSNTFARLVLIDSTVGDRQTLINSVAPGTAVMVLDADRDGVEQITAALAVVDGLESLHIVSHGTPGCLSLGNTQLSLSTLSQYAPQIEAWNAAIAPNASILLYGCNVAAGDAGAEFIESLQALTHANIGASQTLTGNAALGGNWDLEVTTGAIAPLAFDADALAAYAEVLATATLGDASWVIEEDISPVTGDISDSTEGGLKGLDRQSLIIGGEAFDAADFVDAQTGATITGTRIINGVTATVEYRVLAGLNGEPVLRTFVTLNNAGATAATTSLKLEDDIAGSNLKVSGSGSGDLVFDASDRFVITEALNDDGVNPGVNTFAFFSSSNPTTAAAVDLGGGPDFQGLETNYDNISLAAGASRSFVFFNSISETVVQATTDSAQFASADTLARNGLLVGLTAAQRTAAGITTTPGNVTITPATGTTTEAGGTATFNVVLSKQPQVGKDVIVTLASSDTTEGTVDKTTLTFTAANFNVPQTVTVKGVDDTIVDGNVAYTVRATFATTDEEFGASLTPVTVALTNTDNDKTTVPPVVPPVTGKTFVGTAKKDTLTGTESNDIILGKGENDTLFGKGGNDSLKGGLGNDKLFGDAGNDTLNGSKGKDKLFGGDGNDVFVVTAKKGADVIKDYKDGQDKIDLTGSLTFGSLTLTQKGKDTVISSGKEVLATLAGVTKTQLSATDFV
jgi:Ca2+-binding RTX toxin-like protein